MTQTEFNDKYREYIETQDGVSFSGLCFNHPAVIEFLDDIFENILTKIPNFKYSQIKLKFGQTRFYSNINCMSMSIMIETKINEILLKDEARR